MQFTFAIAINPKNNKVFLIVLVSPKKVIFEISVLFKPKQKRMGWKIVSLIVSIALVSNLVSSNSEFDLESENSEKAKRCKRGWEPFEDISTLLKRQENGTATTPGVDSCNLNQDCFACNEDPKGCLW